MKKFLGLKAVAEKYAEKKGITKKEAEDRLKDVLEIIMDCIKTSDGIQFINKLTLEKVVRKSRIGRNPKTKEEVMIEEKIAIKTTLGKEYSAILNSK